MKVRTFVRLFACVLLPASALADPHTVPLPSARVTIDVPDDWTPTLAADTLSLSDKRGEIKVTFRVVDSGSVKHATKTVLRELRGACDNLTLKDEQKVSVNGMDGVAIVGDGFISGVKITFVVFVVDTPSADKDLLIIEVGEDAKLASHKPEMEYIFSHLRPQWPPGADPKIDEARTTIRAIAKNYSSVLETEDRSGKPRATRKLVSFPAVPATVPRGAKYQSSPTDWFPWAPIRTVLDAPQYFQYEVRAASDGQSADILARGDLNGDAKTSLFRLRVELDPAGCCLRVAPSIVETDPGE